MKLDILAFGAHPDDVELGAGGTLAAHAAKGHKIGIIDLTAGELGTRGTPEVRQTEAKEAAKILGVNVREIMRLKDGFFENNQINQLEVIRRIRKYRPEIILCNAPSDRHPDHGRAAQLVLDASFYAGLRKIETTEDGELQQAWRPKAVYHYIQFYSLKPHFVFDISSHIQAKMRAIKAHSSQFYNPESDEPETLIASKEFFESLEGRAREYGRIIYCEFGEGFIAPRMPGIENLFNLK